MIDRRHARTLAMQALCLFEAMGNDFGTQLTEFLSDENPPEDVLAYARAIVLDVRADQNAIDECIQQSAENWEIRRMAAIDRNVIRVAVCEIMHRPEVPPRSAVNEAIEIGKAFGTKDSPSFINGVLDAILKRKTASPTQAEA